MVDEAGTTPRAVAERMVAAIRSGEFERLRELVHLDVVQEMPQSGERVRGVDNLIATFTRRPDPTSPGLGTAELTDVVGEEPRYVMTPTFTLVRVEGTGENLAVVARSRYPDGSDWYVISLLTFRDGRIAKNVSFFAPCYEAPEWRAPWVEPLE
jgi:ketosteroid isomerase-like protein